MTEKFLCITRMVRSFLATKSGVGMRPPFYAETASVKNNLTWPYWIVRNASCNSLGSFWPRPWAEALAREMNTQVEAK